MRKYIVGNWKMYKTAKEAQEFIAALKGQVKGSAAVMLAVPFTALHAVSKNSAPIAIGAQNMHDATEGAFTGEISARMLKEAGASFVLLGHSERRHIFQETNAFIQRKVKRALAEGLTPMLCVGETEKERAAKQTEAVLTKQLTECLADLSADEIKKCFIAYEPVWAIGTGNNATPEIAEEAHQICREFLRKKGADKLPLLYGGSVKPENAQALLKMANIDGLLVGGASLDAGSFAKIINQGNL